MVEREGAESGNGQKVLLVEDDAFMVRVLKMKLEQAGFHVLTAQNGCEGLEKIKEHSPRVVVTDLNMPRMNGYELCSEINNSLQIKPTILVVSSVIEREKLESLREFPNVHFVDKPVSPKNVLTMIKNCFEHTSYEEAL